MGWFGKRAGKSLEDGTGSTNQTKYGQIRTESRLLRGPFRRHLPFPVLLLNQPNTWRVCKEWLFHNQFENKEINKKKKEKKHTTYDGRSSGDFVNNCLINVAKEEEYCDGTSWEEHSTD